MTEIQIRALEPEDLPALTEVYSQPRFIWGTLQLPHTSLDARRKRHQAAAPGQLQLVALIEARPVGSAGLHPAENRRRAHCATIGMGVHDAFAGRGVGRALLAALLEQSDRWLNYSRLELTVWSDNARAIALYEQAGFAREGLLRAYAFRDGAYADALTMARLKPGFG
ncbi:MAG TPA: GNAT family N-acetyltransferase [Rhizomicrobium sp.]|jgi:putative acetyltransferase|nr:GNAT family N-acetyltransferase [Rhizomicrobium sp.]